MEIPGGRKQLEAKLFGSVVAALNAGEEFADLRNGTEFVSQPGWQPLDRLALVRLLPWRSAFESVVLERLPAAPEEVDMVGVEPLTKRIC